MAVMTFHISKEEIERHLVYIPTLVVIGTQDALIPASSTRKLAQDLRAAKVLEFSEAGHCVHEQHADEVNEAIIRHIELFDKGKHEKRTTRVAKRAMRSKL
jgi:pimeloyl-ACP methyl ester carboxylesterase